MATLVLTNDEREELIVFLEWLIAETVGPKDRVLH